MQKKKISLPDSPFPESGTWKATFQNHVLPAISVKLYTAKSRCREAISKQIVLFLDCVFSMCLINVSSRLFLSISSLLHVSCCSSFRARGVQLETLTQTFILPAVSQKAPHKMLQNMIGQVIMVTTLVGDQSAVLERLQGLLQWGKFAHQFWCCWQVFP